MFITFEGPDGSGKTTAITKIKNYLEEHNVNFLLTREPGTNHDPLAQKIRKIIISDDIKISPMTEAILFMADRRQHLENVIWPNLNKNILVLCDRYFDSTFAYQGHARGLGLNKMIELNESITENTYPDITIYFDLPYELAKSRTKQRGDENRLDMENDDFVQKVHEGYHQIIDMFPKRYRIVDASKTPEEVFEAVKEIFKKEILNIHNKNTSI